MDTAARRRRGAGNPDGVCPEGTRGGARRYAAGGNVEHDAGNDVDLVDMKQWMHNNPQLAAIVWIFTMGFVVMGIAAIGMALAPVCTR